MADYVYEVPDYEPELTVLSYGGGQDSTAILLMLLFDDKIRNLYAPNNLLVIMSDTGNEYPMTYEHVGLVAELCEEHGVEFAFLTKELGYHTDSWPDLVGMSLRNPKSIMSVAYPKTCTVNLKINPVYKFVEDYIEDEYGYKVSRKRGVEKFAAEYGRIWVLLGIAKGEETRLTTTEKREKEALWKQRSLDYLYPLIYLGMDRFDCQEYIRDVGVLPVPPPSNCMMCPYQQEREWLYLARYFPEDFQVAVEIEARKLEEHRRMGVPDAQNKGITAKMLHGRAMTLPEYIELAEKKFGHMTREELEEYRFSHGHCVESSY
jgi:3'-phosphoadenosine 5'-phosphosulfate sulfotransferase (PAPS reductase)/FAD synthetase